MADMQKDLVAALSSESNAQVLDAITKNMAPYAMLKGESVAEFTDKLLRGTTIEGFVNQAQKALKSNG